MKSVIMLASLFVSTAAFAGEPILAPAQPSAACTAQNEGERAYLQNGEDQDVYVCENGGWVYLDTRTPDDNRN